MGCGCKGKKTTEVNKQQVKSSSIPPPPIRTPNSDVKK